MIRSQLVTHLHFGKTKKNRFNPPEVYSYRRGETWYWVRTSPGHSFTYKVVEFDDAGLEILQAKERKEESRD